MQIKQRQSIGPTIPIEIETRKGLQTREVTGQSAEDLRSNYLEQCKESKKQFRACMALPSAVVLKVKIAQLVLVVLWPNVGQ